TLGSVPSLVSDSLARFCVSTVTVAGGSWTPRAPVGFNGANTPSFFVYWDREVNIDSARRMRPNQYDAPHLTHLVCFNSQSPDEIYAIVPVAHLDLQGLHRSHFEIAVRGRLRVAVEKPNRHGANPSTITRIVHFRRNWPINRC
ncbi:MAG TPA: hypothetical protein VGD54_17250, partial [Steroidobacteraceae bacterium]